MADITMKCGLLDRIYLCFHTAASPDDAEWSAYVEDMAKSADRFDVMLVFSAGGGPTGPQRRAVAALWQVRGRMPRIALVTPSAVVRRAGTALNWVLRQPIKTFTPKELDASLIYLGLDEEQRDGVKAKLAEWCSDLGLSLA